MKRILSLILTVLLLPGLLAVPAHADDGRTIWVQLLDYGYPVGYDSNYIPLSPNFSVQAVQYNNPNGGSLYYCDILFRTDISDLKIGTYSSYLTIVNLGDGLYRAFGQMFYNNDGSDSIVYFEYSAGTYIEILSFRGSTHSLAIYPNVVDGIVYEYDDEPAIQHGIYYYDQDGTWKSNIVRLLSDTIRLPWRAELDIHNWQDMDFLQLSMSAWADSIDSVQVLYKGVNVPFTFTQPTSNQVSGGGPKSLFLLDLLIDVRNLDRDASANIFVQVTGSQKPNEEGNFIIQSCYGFIQPQEPSLWTHWFSQVGDWLASQTYEITTIFASWGNTISYSLTTWGDNIRNSIESSGANIYSLIDTWGRSINHWVNSIDSWSLSINANILTFGNRIVETVADWGQSIVTSVSTWGQNIVDAILGNRDGSQLQDDLNNAVGSLDQAGQVMDSVQRPDIGHVNIDVAGMVPASGIGAVGSLVGIVYQSPVLGPIMLMFFTLSLAAFVIFGRR